MCDEEYETLASHVKRLRAIYDAIKKADGFDGRRRPYSGDVEKKFSGDDDYQRSFVHAAEARFIKEHQLEILSIAAQIVKDELTEAGLPAEE